MEGQKQKQSCNHAHVKNKNYDRKCRKRWLFLFSDNTQMDGFHLIISRVHTIMLLLRFKLFPDIDVVYRLDLTMDKHCYFPVDVSNLAGDRNKRSVVRKYR